MPSLRHSPSPTHLDPESKPSESDVRPGTVLPHARRSKAGPKAPSNPITIFPLQRRFAVIQMDPTAMVSHLDTQALEEAQELRPKKYLILTSFVRLDCRSPASDSQVICSHDHACRAYRSPSPVTRGPSTMCGPSAPRSARSTRSGAWSPTCASRSIPTRHTPPVAPPPVRLRRSHTTTATTGLA